MPRIPDSARGPAIALNSFWREVVSDGGLLEKTLSAAEALLGQLYYDMLRGVLGIDLRQTPVFGRVYFQTMRWTRAARLTRIEDGQTVYYYPLPPQVVAVPVLYNQATRPTMSLERAVDYTVVELNGGRWLRTAADFFGLSQVRIDTRTQAPVVTVYGVDGQVSAGLADTALPDPDADPAGYATAINVRHAQRRRFASKGRMQVVRAATFAGADSTRVRTRTAVFSPADVGRKLEVYPGPVEYTIVEVTSGRAARVSAPIAAVAPFDFAIKVDDVFTADDVGADITIQYPTDPGLDGVYRVSDVLSSTEVLLDRALPFPAGDPPDAEGIRWTLTSAPYVQEAVLYARDVVWDHEDLARRHGRLLGRARASSASYRAYLRAAQVFFWGGPTVRGMTALMTLSAGLPVVATDSEVLLRVETGSGVDIVTTTGGVYVQPTGLLREDISDRANWGTLTLSAFEALTDAFTVRDDDRDPTWLYDQTLPQDMLPAVDGAGRRVLPSNRPMFVGGGWGIGDPGAYVGSDSDGRDVTPYIHRGSDAIWFDDGSTYGALQMYESPVRARFAGRQAYFEGKFSRVATANPAASTVQVGDDIADVVARLAFTGLGAGDVLTVTAGDPPRRWRDVGRWLSVAGTPYKVVDVPGPDQLQLVDALGAPAVLAGSPACVWGVRYAIIERAPMITSTGIMAAHLASPNVFGVEYDANQFSAVLAQLLQDTTELIGQGRPAHARPLTSPLFRVQDEAVFLEEAALEMAYPVHYLMAPRHVMYVGDPWDVGEYHWSPRGDVRFFDRLIPGDMAGAADPPAPGGVWRAGVLDLRACTELALALNTTVGGGGSYAGRVLVWDSNDPSDVGGTWVPSGHTFLLTEALPAAVLGVGGVIAALELTVTTDAIMAIGVGARFDSVQEVRSPAHLPAGVGATSVGLDTVELAPFLVWPVDVGRRLVLTYPAVPSAGLAQHTDVVRVVGLTSTTQVSVVDETTGSVYAAPRTSAAVAWRFGAHRGWGQTPRSLGDPPRWDTWPGARTTRLGMVSDLAVEVSMVAK